MTAPSLLFKEADDSARTSASAPDCFVDLNLDQVVGSICARKQAYDLEPFFHAPLQDLDAIHYRHEVFRELDNDELHAAVARFAQGLSTMRQWLNQAEEMHYERQKQRWFVDAVGAYCEAVQGLARRLFEMRLHSRAFQRFRQYLDSYTRSPAFTDLASETTRLQSELEAIRYCVRIRGNTVRVTRYEGEANYSAAVLETFSKFKQGEVKGYEAKFIDSPNMNHVEAQVLQGVVKLHPDLFARVEQFCRARADFMDAAVARFDREVQFYVGYLEYTADLKKAGLAFALPALSDTDKAIAVAETFDLALAHKLVVNDSKVVTNDVTLDGPERIIVVSGPNQGGKTTFARTVGQLHYLAALGCPVPGRQAKLFLCDAVLTQFEREEDIANLRGKLEDDLVRIRRLLERATSSSVIILNELFSSTSTRDARWLGETILRRIMDLDALGVYITFIDELSTLSEQTVSMSSTVDADDPSVRTFKVVRKAADGRAYAITLAEQHGLTYRKLINRIAS